MSERRTIDQSDTGTGRQASGQVGRHSPSVEPCPGEQSKQQYAKIYETFQAVEILQTHGNELRDERIKVYRELASFADECSQGLASYFNSSAFQEDTQYLAEEKNLRKSAAQLEDQDMRNTKVSWNDSSSRKPLVGRSLRAKM